MSFCEADDNKKQLRRKFLSVFIAGVGYVLIGKTAETLPAGEKDY